MERPGVWLRRRLASRTKDLFQPPGDARLVEVVGRHLHFDPITDSEAHPAFAHLAANGGEDEVLVVELHPEHGAGQDDFHATLDFDMLFHYSIK